jgi:hypothetical protein
MEEALKSPKSDVQVRDLDNTLTFHVVLHNRAATFMYLYLSSGTVTVTVQNIRSASGALVYNGNTGLLVSNNRLFTISNVDHQIDNDHFIRDIVTNVSTIPHSTEFRVEATAYREFDIVISDKTKIKIIGTPSFFSRWKMDMFSGCTNLESLFARGRIVKSGQEEHTDTYYLRNCKKIKTVWVDCNPEIVMDMNDFKDIIDGETELEDFHLYPYTFDFPMGGSYIFNINTFVEVPIDDNNQLITHFKYFSAAGSYAYPLRGVTGEAATFDSITGLTRLTITYTSVTPRIYSKQDVTVIYNNNMETYNIPTNNGNE